MSNALFLEKQEQSTQINAILSRHLESPSFTSQMLEEVRDYCTELLITDF